MGVLNGSIEFPANQPLQRDDRILIGRLAFLMPHGRQIRPNSTSHSSVNAYGAPFMANSCAPDLPPHPEWPTVMGDNAHRVFPIGRKAHTWCVQMVGSRKKGGKPGTARHHDATQAASPAARIQFQAERLHVVVVNFPRSRRSCSIRRNSCGTRPRRVARGRSRLRVSGTSPPGPPASSWKRGPDRVL